MSSNGKLLVIGFGPGAFEHITERAREAIDESDVIIGYNTYVDLIRGLLTDQEIIRTGMTEEVSRAQEAVRQAELGKKVAVISSGDAGVYGMAGLVYEVLIEKGWAQQSGIEVEVIPGISAINSCASLLGAPVMHDACTISLSDHLTPWDVIAKRVEAAASADFVIALYNPRSGRRTRQIVETQRIVLKHRSADTPVGLVKSAYRDREQIVITTLGGMLEHDIGMLTTVIIGNSTTFMYDGLMITPRGYRRKYTLNSLDQPLKPHERLRTEAEPWSLNAKEETREDSRAKPLALAAEALQLVQRKAGAVPAAVPPAAQNRVSILEIGVSPGIANKKMTAKQMSLIAELAGDEGELEYTPHHQVILRMRTDDAGAVAARLRDEGLLVFPIGDVVQVKACDFCNLEKDDAIPVAERLAGKLGGLTTPKELKIGVNGCGMACYGAVMEDIGLVFRKGGYDLFLGGKQIGRNAHAGQNVAEGIPADQIVEKVEQIYKEFKEKAHPGERFHKFFKRVGTVAGFVHEDNAAPVEVNAVCGD
ncbi:precorrin-3B C(17)-methyltransferase [Paenibacillus alkalitolerans]|uniref:precorrin-3B C(17)-methyltransferase n=1 Tax=Paenibacillus alkalitolerans TaxID=2799335 RepID=UPI0018F75619|nr:precorrin-3B C(17)-methyltransferase [Paenibacillus alkalitolerans]